jgi:hypothetical protein
MMWIENGARDVAQSGLLAAYAACIAQLRGDRGPKLNFWGGLCVARVVFLSRWFHAGNRWLEIQDPTVRCGCRGSREKRTLRSQFFGQKVHDASCRLRPSARISFFRC